MTRKIGISNIFIISGIVIGYIVLNGVLLYTTGYTGDEWIAQGLAWLLDKIS